MIRKCTPRIFSIHDAVIYFVYKASYDSLTCLFFGYPFDINIHLNTLLVRDEDKSHFQQIYSHLLER